MAGRGITMVGFHKGGQLESLRINPNWQDASGWTSNKIVDAEKNGSISVLWDHLRNNTLTPEQVMKLLTKDGKVRLREIDTFESNGNSVQVNDLYPHEGKAYGMFMNDKGYWRLLTVGSKTTTEMKIVGADSKRKSIVPLLFSVDNVNVNILNPM